MLLGMLMTLAVPVAAQNAGAPTWLIGNWCLKEEDFHQCIRFATAPDGGLTVAVTYPDDPHPERQTDSVGWMRMIDGRIVSRSDGAGTAYREISRGPSELLMERIEGDGVPRLGYRVTGTTLTVFYTRDDGSGGEQLYQLAR